ncbi:RNA polymerase sigma factor [Echinicola sp. 20G]|uniref:RNA polymerase sigma factor n=1 Tax=Echinicola sp. 20G TaxID=2781961 RepID=UPI0019104E97|nr:RNA polymerase sigma-70 factor [Echinicola sp. 20G]
MGIDKKDKIFPEGIRSNYSSLKDLFYTYHKKLVYYAMQIVGDQSLADDLVQEVFIHVSQWPESHFFREEDHIRNYLYKAVKNQSINALKDLKKNASKMEELDPEAVQGPTALHRLIQSEIVSMVYEAMKSLPEGCRTVAELSYLEGKSNKEVADILGVTVNTVKTQKQRSLKLLKLRIDPEVFTLFLILINC